MPYGSQRWGGEAYGGSTLGRESLPSNALTVPGFAAAYYWTQTGSSSAYGQSAYGGQGATTYPAAGLMAAPDPLDGTVTLWLWWAYASEVTVTRIDHADGTRTEVRDSPVALTPALSRRSQALNPKARDVLTGYTAGTNTTISRLTGLTTPSSYVTTGVRATATAAGQAVLQTSSEPVGRVPTTYGFWVRTSALASAIELSVVWYDYLSNSLGTQTYAASTTARTQAVGAWSWVTITIDTWPADGVLGVASYTASGLPAGGTFDVTGRIIETGSALRGDYFDGDFPGAAWSGAPGLSYSDISPIVYAIDAEAPLDREFHYELTSGLVPGYAAHSTAVELDASQLGVPYDSLLTHPGLAKTIPVWVEEEPELTRDLERGEFQIIGRKNPVIVAAPQRSGGKGELTFVTESHAERAALVDLLEDGSPLLLRSPATHGHPPLWWLAMGQVVLVQPDTKTANADQVLRVRCEITESDRPSAATRPLVA